MKKTFVFDMDGVLIDSERLLLECFLAVAPNQYDPSLIERALRESLGVTPQEVTRIMLRYMGADFPLESCARSAEKLYFERVAAEGAHVKPGARALLEYLHEQGYAVGLASSSPSPLVEKQLRLADLTHFFRVVICGDMVQNSKPAPDIYLLCCRSLGVSPADAYAVEDSPKGIRSAAAAGLEVLMVPDLVPANDELRPLCQGIYHSLTEVLAWVKKCASSRFD